MKQGLVASSSVRIAAPREAVWAALVDPALIRRYMFGTEVVSTWQPGSAIVWKGSWKGKAYEDHGVILHLEPRRTLQYSHFSPLAGLPDSPENYHRVTIELEDDGDQTRVSLAQEGNRTAEERAHSQENWRSMLVAMKDLLEHKGP